jgi:hypothetical protein
MCILSLRFTAGFVLKICSQDATAAGKHSKSDLQHNAVSGSDTLTDTLVESATHGTSNASSSNSSSDDDRIAVDSAASIAATASATAGVAEAGKLALRSNNLS